MPKAQGLAAGQRSRPTAFAEDADGYVHVTNALEDTRNRSS